MCSSARLHIGGLRLANTHPLSHRTLLLAMPPTVESIRILDVTWFCVNLQGCKKSEMYTNPFTSRSQLFPLHLWFTWIVLGLCLDYAWIMLRLYLDHAWIVQALCLYYAWIMNSSFDTIVCCIFRVGGIYGEQIRKKKQSSKWNYL